MIGRSRSHADAVDANARSVLPSDTADRGEHSGVTEFHTCHLAEATRRPKGSQCIARGNGPQLFSFQFCGVEAASGELGTSRCVEGLRRALSWQVFGVRAIAQSALGRQVSFALTTRRRSRRSVD
jgi:hypothetical protein